MLSISELYQRALQIKERRGWEKIYIAVDIHETILLPTYSEEVAADFYPYAKKCLQHLTLMDDVVLIMWTCSSEAKNTQFLKWFHDQGIYFEYINENPEVKNTSYASFDKKMYVNMILDDKAGFQASTDWVELYMALTGFTVYDLMKKHVEENMEAIIAKTRKELHKHSS